jgi:RNA polymerase sigma factor (sigma-70 family)
MATQQGAGPARPDSGHSQPDPLTELYRTQRAALLKVAMLVTGDWESAEDAVHEAFEKTHRGWEGIEDKDRARGYLMTATVNAARSVRRRRSVSARLDVKWLVRDAPAADAALDLAEEHAVVARAVRQLPRRQQQVIALRYWAQLTDGEIADQLNMTISSVRSHASRGAARIGRYLVTKMQS